MSIEKRAHKAGFADVFVARPILGMVLNLLIIIAGLTALGSVDIREMPDVDRPVLSVRTTYNGAVASTVDTEVTQVLEDALSALDGMSYIESTSSSGSRKLGPRPSFRPTGTSSGCARASPGSRGCSSPAMITTNAPSSR